MTDNDMGRIQREREIDQLLMGKVSEEMVSTLSTHAVAYARMEDYKKAIQLQQKVLLLCGQLDRPHQSLAVFHTDLGRFYFLDGDFRKAAESWEQALPMVEKFGSHYEFLLEHLAYVYTETGDKENQLRLFGLIQEHNEQELKKPCATPRDMLERADYHELTGDPATARKYYLQVLQMDLDGKTRTDALEKYASFLWKQQDYIGAAENYRLAANLWMASTGKDSRYAKDVLASARFYYQGGMYSQSIEVYKEASDTFWPLADPSAPQHVVECWNGIGNAYMAEKDYVQAARWYLKLMRHLEGRQPIDGEYPKAVLQLAKAEKFNGEYDRSIEHHLTAMEMFRQLDMMREYADCVCSLKFCLLYAKRRMTVLYDEERADAAQKESISCLLNNVIDDLDVNHSFMGKLEYTRVLSTIAGLYRMRKDIAHAEEYYHRLLPILRGAVREQFRLQDERQRMETWAPMAGTIQDIKGMLADTLQGSQEMVGGMAAVTYDAMLLHKGILLNSSIEFDKVLAESDDEELAGVLRQIRANEAELEDLRRSEDYADSLDKVSQLSQHNQALQLHLYEKCAEFADFTDYISYDWKDVQDRLADTDVAIEFIRYNKFSMDNEASEKMVALVLTREMDQPVAVKIWDNDDLKTWSLSDEYQQWERKIVDSIAQERCDDKLIKSMEGEVMESSSCFRPEMLLLLQCLRDDMMARTTYSPAFMGMGMITYDQLLSSGAVFQTDAAGDIIWGRLQRYLEGKERVFFSADGCFHHLAVEYLPFCGFFFSELFEAYRLSSTKVLCSGHCSGDIRKAVLMGDISYGDAMPKDAGQETPSDTASLRYRLTRLSMSSRELSGIQAVLKAEGVEQVRVIRDKEASKAAFMALSGSGIDVLHIITHGFAGVRKGSTDSEAMRNCLLAFTGTANDGEVYVSAAEVARMNLRHCGLVSLSACNTGYGKLGDDGVFGLQRGFKNAGAWTLLMCLNPVEDTMTADLMSCFYQLMMKGEPKRAALVKAQQRVRRTGEKGWRYWKDFIMLDAL